MCSVSLYGVHTCHLPPPMSYAKLAPQIETKCYPYYRLQRSRLTLRPSDPALTSSSCSPASAPTATALPRLPRRLMYSSFSPKLSMLLPPSTEGVAVSLTLRRTDRVYGARSGATDKTKARTQTTARERGGEVGVLISRMPFMAVVVRP